MSERSTNNLPGNAPSRIIEAAIRSIKRDGFAGASMTAIAEEAEVSKALLHYHFADRAQLLAQVIRALGARVTQREHVALDRADPAASVDALWSWLSDELARGELRALLTLGLTLGLADASAMRHEVAAASRARRASAERTVTQVFVRLGLSPRVPAALIAGACLAFIDGLVMNTDATGNARVAFDVFWLGMLSLAD